MKRKVIALMTAVMMAVSAFSVCSAASVTDFKDVPTESWYYESVKGAVEKGYMNGVSSDMFAPKNNLTRAMFATMLARYDKATVDDTAVSSFADVLPNMWYTGSVVWGNQNGIIKGYSDTKFGTEDFIKREDIAVMVARYIKFKNLTLKEKPADQFKDVEQVSDYAKEAVEFCRIHGLFLGDQNGNLYPLKLITRAEAAAVMERIDAIINENKPSEEIPGGGGGGAGGGGGGGTPVDPTPTPSEYTYADYKVNVFLGKKGTKAEFDLPSYDATTNTATQPKSDASNVYHVKYKNGVIESESSEDISLLTVAKGVCNEINIEDVLKIIRDEIKFEYPEGNVQNLITDNKVNDLLLKQVYIVDVFEDETMNGIVEDINNTLEDINNTLKDDNKVTVDEISELLDIIGVTEGANLTPRDKVIAEKISGKLGEEDNKNLVERVLSKNSTIENVMKEVGYKRHEDVVKYFEGVVEKYKTNLKNILDGNGDDTESTKGGLNIEINIVDFAKTQYAKGLHIFVEKLFPENSLVLAEEFEKSDEALALYEYLNPDEWFNRDMEAGYTLLTENQYESKFEKVVDLLNDIREKFIVGKEKSDVEDVITEVEKFFKEKFGVEVNANKDDLRENEYFITADQLANALVKPEPTLEHLSTDNNKIEKDKIGIISVTKKMTYESALDYINRFAGSTGVTGDDAAYNDPMFEAVANKVAGKYTFKITINYTSCVKEAKH